MFGRVSKLLKNQNIFEVADAVKHINTASQKGITAIELTSVMPILYEWKDALIERLSVPPGIDKKHWIRARRCDGRVIIEWKDRESDPWIPFQLLKSEGKLDLQLTSTPMVPLSAEKESDSRKQLKFIPAGTLSYVPAAPQQPCGRSTKK